MKGRKAMFLGLAVLLLAFTLLAGCKPKVTFVKEGPPADAKFVSDAEAANALNQGAEKAGQAYRGMSASVNSISAYGGKCCWFCGRDLCCDPKCLS